MSRSGLTAASAAALLLAAAAGAVLVGTVLAQVPVDECGPVDLDPDSYQRTVDGDTPARIVVDVANGGAVGGTAWVNASNPSGWTVDVTPASFPLNGSETREAQVTATPADADPDDSPFQLAISSDLVCSAGGLGSPGSASDEEEVELQLQGAPSSSGGPDGGASGPVSGGPGMGLVVLGSVAVLSVVGYPVVRRRTQAHAEASTPGSVQRIPPGSGGSFPVVVRNAGGKAGVFELELEGLPADWSGFLALPSLELEPGEEETVQVLVRPPDDAGSADRAMVRVRVSPDGGGDAEVVELTAQVNPETVEPGG